MDQILEAAARGAEGEPVAGGEVGGGVLEDEVVGEQGEEGALGGVARGGGVGGDTHGMPAFVVPWWFRGWLLLEVSGVGVGDGCVAQGRARRAVWLMGGGRSTGSCLSWSSIWCLVLCGWETEAV